MLFLFVFLLRDIFFFRIAKEHNAILLCQCYSVVKLQTISKKLEVSEDTALELLMDLILRGEINGTIDVPEGVVNLPQDLIADQKIRVQAICETLSSTVMAIKKM